jgi:hypothetical protein
MSATHQWYLWGCGRHRGRPTKFLCVWRVVAASRSSYVVVIRVLMQLLIQESALGSGTLGGQWSLLLCKALPWPL